MSLVKVAQKVTPQGTYFAYAKATSAGQKYYWRNPFNDRLLPITCKNLKSWEQLKKA